jgi:hypothetical protein
VGLPAPEIAVVGFQGMVDVIESKGNKP